MKLVSSPASPFARKVRVVIRELGLTGEVEEMRVATTPLATAEAVRAANPLGKIPALIRDGGRALHDSRVITRYLDARAGGGLYPQERLWEVLTLESIADGIMDAAILCVYEGRLRPEAQRSPEWVAAQWNKVISALDAVNGRWMGHLAGPLDAGQIALGCALGYLDFRHGARDWRQGRDALAGWFAGFDSRPAMAATRPSDG